MKRTSISLKLLVIISLLPLSVAYAIPNLISYQGILNDDSGVPISSTVSMTFRIYDVATGGTAIWSETQSVQVSNGLFNVELGSVQQLPLSVFMQDTLYLGIQVGADPEMAPRQRIASGSYTYRAAQADNAAQADMATEVEEVIVPVGSIIAWAKSLSGVPALPEGWVECNGQTLSDPESPLDGQVIPALNGSIGTQRFLRGSITSGATGGLDSHSHSSIATGGAIGGSGDYLRQGIHSTNHLPPYYNVVWIMKTK